MRFKTLTRRCSGNTLLWLACWTFALAAVASAAEIDAPMFAPGQILESSTGRPLAFEDFISKVATAAVVYVGEEHRNHSHVEAAVKILGTLIDRKHRPILGLEMFSWDGQAGLDHYLSDPDMSTHRFLEESDWKQNWSGPYEDYDPLIRFARDHHIPVIALNAPRALVRKVAKQGLTQARNDPDMAHWAMRDESMVEDPLYRDRIFTQLRACHGGLSDAEYQHMYEASVFRDEAMAKTITEQLRRVPHGGGPIVSYTGGGHIQYQLPIPNRVARRYSTPLVQITVYLLPFDPASPNELGDLLTQHIADYVWLTPLSTQGSVPRCF